MSDDPLTAKERAEVESLVARTIAAHPTRVADDLTDGIYIGWIAATRFREAQEAARIGRRDFNAEHSDRPGVSVGEDLVDKWRRASGSTRSNAS